MKEQLISFKTAKLAKEKGFDWAVNYVYPSINKPAQRYNTYSDESGEYQAICNSIYSDDTCFTAPTQSLLQKWLRENHKLYIHAEMDYYCGGWFYNMDMHSGFTPERMVGTSNNEIYESYEEALEEGLYEALKMIKND